MKFTSAKNYDCASLMIPNESNEEPYLSLENMDEYGRGDGQVILVTQSQIPALIRKLQQIEAGTLSLKPIELLDDL